MEVFKNLNSVDVREHTETKNGLSYLSWAWAWAETKKRYPDANYTIGMDEIGEPYIYDENLGYMVFTSVTIEGLTHEMWLPVMDSANNAMKDKQYEIETKHRTVVVKPATMFDINRAIMRCLTKNLAMFGLGLYIYAGEDLPESVKEEEDSLTREELIAKVNAVAEIKGITEEKICSLSKKGVTSISDMDKGQLHGCLNWLQKQEVSDAK